MKTAILFLIFNRLDTTKKVFEQIRKAKPKKLYIASDGARSVKEGEDKIVESVRTWVLDHIDWPCQVQTHFNKENLGCGKNISQAVTWFFENESEGIILEDDCVPHPDFFPYCEELLNKYRNDKRVWHITGYNPLITCDIPESYYFAKRMHCWGWASWANRWKHYQFDLEKYDDNCLRNFSSDNRVITYWKSILNQMKQHKIDTWDYQWAFCINKYNGLCINPAKNLVSNIGDVGVHYTNGGNDLHQPVFNLLPLIHPISVEAHRFLIPLIDQKLILNTSQQIAKMVLHVSVFGFIPFLKIKKRNNSYKVSIWGIPLLKIKKKK